MVPVLPDGWQAEEILSRGLVAAFLHVRPALACAPPSDAASAGRGWPSPRTWEMAARLMAAAGAAGTGDEARSALIRGAVGDGAGVEFLAWLVEMDLPDPEQVLADPASFRLPERGDRAYAALAAIAAAVAADPTPDRWTAGWQVLGLAADAAPDVAAVAARVLARCRPDGAALPAEIHLFAPVLRDAGLLRDQRGLGTSPRGSGGRSGTVRGVVPQDERRPPLWRRPGCGPPPGSRTWPPGCSALR